jgi:hypothetical protein
MEKFSIANIMVGDEVLFVDGNKIEHNLYWKVINFFSKDRVIVEIRDMGYAEKLMIDIRDIIDLQRSGLQMEQI